jgi:hypothetical protein
MSIDWPNAAVGQSRVAAESRIRSQINVVVCGSGPAMSLSIIDFAMADND